ncbi:hypothetical protein BC941DRAFT_464229 [Chlamydoabsidia padenii]|nr:hypothetical protein BC941DRAFT_464229 [Chlamydoabsidia padenii]
MSRLPHCLKDSRCILHIDLDCFFSQVEEVRLGLDSSKPVAVQQWSSLIAVNYAARASGVTRHCSVEEAKKLCPDITLVHVATYAPNETTARYHDNPSRTTHKVSLDSYRDAGKKIFGIFNQYCTLLQKVGTDEAFLDVTETVNQRLCNEYIPSHPVLLDHLDSDGDSTAILDDFMVDWPKVNYIIDSSDEKRRMEDLVRQHGDDTDDIDNDSTYRDPTSWFDIQLFITADIAATIRKQIYDELHYTCSAGIAHNKVLAKLGSSRNKPNKQTVIRHHLALEFMKEVPFNKIRNLGGKFGHAVENEYNVQKASDLWQYHLNELQQKFGESSGLWLYNIVRGIDNEEVILLKAPKSLMASKTHRPPITKHQDLLPWYTVLSGELHQRVMTNWNEHHNWPKTLSISYRTYNTTRSRSTAMLHRSEFETSEKLQLKVASMFEEVLDEMFPLNLMAIQATGLTPDASVTNHTINRFFTTTGSTSTAAPEKSHTDYTNTETNGKNQIVSGSSTTASTTLNTSKPTRSSLEHFFMNQPRNNPTETIDNSSTSSPSPPSLTRTPKPEPPSSLVHFFTNNKSNKTTDQSTVSNSAHPPWTSTTTWVCDKCHQRILLEKVDEHTDYHFALELAKEGNDDGVTDTGKRKDCQERDNSGDSGKKAKRYFFYSSPS